MCGEASGSPSLSFVGAEGVVVATDPRQGSSGRTLIGLCIAMGGSLVIAASLNYVFTPMIDDLGLTQDEASIALTIPPIGALLIVFLAGRFGDQLGHRRVVTVSSVAFVVGSAIVAAAQGITLVTLGLLIASIAATAIQIVVIGLLSLTFPDPRARAAAFGTFGMVSPAIWLTFPVLTGWVVEDHSWRWVTALWVVAGLLMLLAARYLLPAPVTTGPVGEIRAPLFAGIAVALGVQALSRLSDDGISSPWTWGTMIVAAAAAVLCLWRLRDGATTFSLAPLRKRASRALLIVVVIIPFINTVFLMTMAFQFLYGLSVLQTALVMVPAQAAAVLGTKLIAGPLMRRIGIHSTAALLFGMLAVAMLGSFFVTADSPLGVAIVYVTVYNLLTVAASITITSGVMETADKGQSGLVAAYRGSAVALGAALAVVIMNPFVFGLARLTMNAQLQESGLTAEESEELMADIQQSSTTSTSMTQYAYPLPDGTDLTDVMADSIARGLHINGVAGTLLALVSVWLVLRARKASSA